MATKREKLFGLYIIMFILAFALTLSACSAKQSVDNTPNKTEERAESVGEPVVEMYAYKIRLRLTCTVKGDNGQDKDIICTYDGKTQAETDNVNFTVKIGETFSELKAATPTQGNTVGAEEYRFIGWYYTDNNGNDIKVDKNTAFTEEVFGKNVEITLNAKCERVFSPTMPL